MILNLLRLPSFSFFKRKLSNLSVEEMLPSCFVNPTIIEEKLNNVLYFVERTKVGKNLPVYLESRNKGKDVFTLIRHELKKEIESICKLEERRPKVHRKGGPTLCAIESIQIKEDMNQIKILGDHLLVIKNHLTNKGF